MPVPVENNSGFDFETAYQNASATYLVNLEEQLIDLGTETPGKYLMELGGPIILTADVTAGEDAQQFSFMPGLSDVKAMARGEFIRKSRETYEAALQGKSGSHKTYGGGAYMDCLIFYDLAAKEWKPIVLNSDVLRGCRVLKQMGCFWGKVSCAIGLSCS